MKLPPDMYDGARYEIAIDGTPRTYRESMRTFRHARMAWLAEVDQSDSARSRSLWAFRKPAGRPGLRAAAGRGNSLFQDGRRPTQSRGHRLMWRRSQTTPPTCYSIRA